MKIHHQQGAKLNNSDLNVGTILGEYNNFHQIGYAYLQYEITSEKDEANQANRILINGDTFRLINNAFAYCFKEAKISTTGGQNLELINFVGKFQQL